MEENSNENAFIIQTIDLTSTNSDEAPIVISTTELNNTSQYITCYENGEIVLKELEDTVQKAPKKKNVSMTKKGKLNTNYNKPASGGGGVVNNKVQQKQTVKPRKRLCYEKPFNIQQVIKMQSKHDAQVVLKHPRKQIIDHKIMISPREFKCQLNYTADTVTTTKLAPCTRQQLVHVLNGITTLFAHPAHKMPNNNLMQLYVSRCTCKKEPNMMSTEDMNLLPLIENIAKQPPSSNNINTSVKKIYGKRKNLTEIPMEMQKMQIIENANTPDSNINLSSIKKIYRNRKCTTETTVLISDEKQQINENIDHKYSKKITNESGLNKIKNETPECDENTIYSITLDLDDIKEENLRENQIVILSVDNDGELTENNINVLLDAAANLKTDISNENDKVVALTRNLGSDDFNNKLSNIFVVRTSDDNNDCEQILGDITTSS